MSPRLPVIYIYLPVPWESQEINEVKDLGSSQKAFKSPVKDFMTPKGFSSKIKSKICSTRKSLSKLAKVRWPR